MKCVSILGVCPWNGMVLMENGQPKTCKLNSQCRGSGYTCQNGHCCPQRINTGKNINHNNSFHHSFHILSYKNCYEFVGILNFCR